MKVAKLLASTIKHFMYEHDLNQAQLAERSGLDQPVISRLLSGQANPQIKTLQSVAKALDVKLYELLMPSSERQACREALEARPLYARLSRMEEMLQEMAKAPVSNKKTIRS